MEHNNCLKILISNGITALLVLSVSVLLIMIGHDKNNYQYVLCGVMLFWAYGMIYGMLDLGRLYGYTIMNFMLFVFFLSRPTLASFYEVGWTAWNDGIVEKALILIFSSEVALFLGSKLIKPTSRPDSLQIKKTPNYNETVQTALLIIVIVTSVFSAYSTLKNYSYYSGLNYEAIYVSGGPQDNAIIRASVTIFPYAAFAYLATMPSKKKAITILSIYVLLGVPMFLLGNRASLVLRIAFAVSYFFIRDYTADNNGEVWIKRSTKIVFVVFVLVSISFLGAFNYYRSGKNPSSEASMPIMLDFFYKQGTTFDTVCQGLQYKPMIAELPHIVPYSIGTIYDTVVHSTLSQMIFGTSSLGSGNSMNMVMDSNSLAHKLSYIVLGDISYLSGHGRGSSYIIELYYDGGLLLVTAFSLVLGLYLANINRIIQQGKWFINTIVISTLPRVFYIPRSSTLDFIAFLFTPHFWLIIVIAIIALFFSESKDSFKRDLRTLMAKEKVGQAG